MLTRILPLLMACLPALVGCRTDAELPDGFCEHFDLKGTPPPDMTPTPAKCAAAKGLSGDILGNVCLDMDKTDKQGLMNLGFNLTASTVNCDGWDISGNNLLPKNIRTGMGGIKCELLLPSIPIDAKYARVTLALIHQANLPAATQQARIEFPDFVGTPLRVWINPATAIDQRTVVEIDTSKIPSGPNAQASIQLGDTAGVTAPSWTITSIAVLGQTAK